MNVYEAYQLCIHSDVKLTIRSGEGGKPDIVIRRRPMEVEKGDGSTIVHCQDEGRESYISDGGNIITGRIYDELRFIVVKGRALYYDPSQHFDKSKLERYLLGVLMAVLLRQRGFLVLHACSVAKKGEAVAFVGESGWGKSTLAEYFCQRGYTLLNDDVLALRVDEDRTPHVIPGYPQIRLRKEAGTYLREDFDTLPSVNAVTEKRVTTPRRFPDTPLPLRKMYMLDPVYAGQNATEPLSQRTALLRLIQHTRVTNLIKETAFKAKHLRQCEHVVQSVSIDRLHRIRDLSRINEIYNLVEQDLDQKISTTAGSV